MLSARDPQSKPSRTFRFFSGARTFVNDLWTAATRGALAVLGLLLIFSLKPLIFDRNFVIGEFVVPDEIKTVGVTSSVIGRLLYERVSQIQRSAKAAVAEQHFNAQGFEAHETVAKIADLKVLGADVNVAALVSQVRGLLGISDTQIVGELAIAAKESGKVSYLLRAHASGDRMWTKQTDPDPSLERLLDDVAKSLVEEFDPLSAGFHYLHSPDDTKTNLDRAIWLADKFQIKDDPRYVWALLLRGMAWREKQKDPGRTRAALCAAIAQDPSFTPAWRVLAISLRADGDFAEAEDLGLRLVHQRPNEPEGWRQLGNLTEDCAAGEEQEHKARQYFEHAMALGAQQHSRGHYLTLVDYARWLYARFQTDKVYPANPTETTLPAQASYLDASSEYLGRAQALAPDQQSVYTMFARVLGHPRDSDDKNPHANEGRYMMAEMKARFALAQDSRKPFANFVMGELLTDEGVERHKYAQNQKEKFAEAASYLAKARAATTVPELQYEAMYARALGGEGKFADALDVLSQLEAKRNKKNFYLVDWVHGELLYNQSIQTKDNSLLNETIEYLRSARQARFCGPRSDTINHLIGVIEGAPGIVVAKGIAPETLSVGRSSVKKSEPVPACAGWSKLAGDELSPWPAADATSAAYLPPFDVHH
jgi:hypothetical protein